MVMMSGPKNPVLLASTSQELPFSLVSDILPVLGPADPAMAVVLLVEAPAESAVLDVAAGFAGAAASSSRDNHSSIAGV
jgi:hypothetical protein